MTDNKTIIG